MVAGYPTAEALVLSFQYSLCRVVLMVKVTRLNPQKARGLSVLALSSRFDGRGHRGCGGQWRKLSVLALSSRFDGHLDAARGLTCGFLSLSVLALSSRFDGLAPHAPHSAAHGPFSTRSVESF